MSKMRKTFADLLMLAGLGSTGFGIYSTWTPYTGMIVGGLVSCAVSIYLVRSQIDP